MQVTREFITPTTDCKKVADFDGMGRLDYNMMWMHC